MVTLCFFLSLPWTATGPRPRGWATLLKTAVELIKVKRGCGSTNGPPDHLVTPDHNVDVSWQEVEALLGENEMLQGKLHSQEEDFRLQNSTLMTELSKVSSSSPSTSSHLVCRRVNLHPPVSSCPAVHAD